MTIEPDDLLLEPNEPTGEAGIWQVHEMVPGDHPHRSVVWRALDGSSMELTTYVLRGQRRVFGGRFIAAIAGVPFHLEYLLHVSANGHSRKVTCTHTGESPLGNHFHFGLDHTERWWWKRAGPGTILYLPDLDGAVEPDLGFTPLTNTLAIWRLGLSVGQSGEIVAAWLRFPELDIVRSRQRYTRVAHNTYRYEDAVGYRFDLEVDDHSFVVRYGDIWERAAVSDGD